MTNKTTTAREGLESYQLRQTLEEVKSGVVRKQDLPRIIYALETALKTQEKLENGYVLVPVEITAENGMKAALSGEFEVEGFYTDEDGNEDIVATTIPWAAIKEIHKAMITQAQESGE